MRLSGGTGCDAIGTYSALADEVFARAARVGPVRVVGIDGRAGSGKTTFAGRLARELERRGRLEGPGQIGARGPGERRGRVAVLHTDDLLDGWTTLLSWQPRLREWVLEPFRRGGAGAWRRYDWTLERLVEEWTPIEVPDVLVVEGVGSVSRAMRADLTLGVVVHAPAEVRLRRGLERDGEALRGQWVRWMALEDEQFGADDPAVAADVVVDGASAVAHDREVEYIIGGGGWTGRATLGDDPESGTDGEGLSG